MDSFIKKGEKYRVAIIRDTNGEFCGAYCPHDDYLDVGDIVKMEDGSMASVMLEDDYVGGDELIKMQEITGMTYKRIISTYRNRPVEWEEESNE